MKLLSLGVLLLSSTLVAGKYPDNYPKCRFADNECIPKAITKVLKIAKDGNPDLGLVKYEPLHLSKVDIIQDPSSSIAIKLTLFDVDLFGISNFEAYKTVGFEKNLEKSKFEAHLKAPKLSLKSKYTIDGKVLILPITGNGNASLSFDDIDIKCKFKAEAYQKDGETYGKISKIKLAFVVSRMHLQLDNLFNGNKALGDNMNVFINENWETIFNELKPAIKNVLTNVVSGLINQVFGTLPYKEWFINDNE